MNFDILDGVSVSIFSMLIVILILMLLAFIISFLRYLPAKGEEKVKKPATAQKQVVTSDQEERMVAMLVASCVAKEQIKQDVRIISVERTK